MMRRARSANKERIERPLPHRESWTNPHARSERLRQPGKVVPANRHDNGPDHARRFRFLLLLVGAWTTLGALALLAGLGGAWITQPVTVAPYEPLRASHLAAWQVPILAMQVAGVLLLVLVLIKASKGSKQAARTSARSDKGGGTVMSPVAGTSDTRAVPDKPSVEVAVAETLESSVETLSSTPLIRAATRRSLLHAQGMRPNEDSYACAVRPEWVVLSVADGVGTSVRAEVASRSAATAAATIIAASLAEYSAHDVGSIPWRGIVHRAMYEAAADLGVHWARGIKGMTTLVVVAISRKAPHRLFFGGLGDSGIGIATLGGSIDWLSPCDQSGALHTTSVTDALPLDVQNAYVGDPRDLADGDVVFLASDGFTAAAGPYAKLFGPEIRDAMTPGTSESGFHDLVEFEMTGPDDDRTIIALRFGEATLETRP
jgi:hypothetical protein